MDAVLDLLRTHEEQLPLALGGLALGVVALLLAAARGRSGPGKGALAATTEVHGEVPPARSERFADRSETVVDVLKWRASAHPHKLLHAFVDDHGAVVRQLTFGELELNARAVAAALQEAGVQKGDRVVLCYPPGLDFVIGFWGCLVAGAVAIPTYPPYPGTLAADLPRFNRVVDDSGAQVVLTNKTYAMASRMGTVRSFFGGNVAWPKHLTWISSDALSAARMAARFTEVALTPDDLAFFQYSSGSTSAPKAVMIAHSNLRGQLLTWDSLAPSDIMVSWLPSYHDMGLIGFVVVPMYTATLVVSMSPISFIKNPTLWLNLITEYRGTHSCAPNFGYALAARKCSDADRDKLVLSQWVQAICAAEPIRAEALRAFHDRFAPVGFRMEAFNCGYGLAEVTLTCAGQDPLNRVPPLVIAVDKARLEADKRAVLVEEEDDGVVVLIGCGRAGPEQTLRIVDGDSRRELPERRVGEIWVAGTSNAQGYYGREEQTAEAFGATLAGAGAAAGADAERHLRTGDLGFLHDGQLFVTGRIKDLIILRGRNVIPQDVELSVENAHPEVRPGCTAAFSVEKNGAERLVVVADCRTLLKEEEERRAVVKAIQQRIFAEHQLPCYAIVLLRPRTIAKTTSGKIQRHASRQQFLDGTLKAQHTAIFEGSSAAPAPSPSPAPAPAPASAASPAPATATANAPGDKTADDVADWLAARLEESTGEPVDRATPWAQLGMDSVAMVNLSADLGDWLGVVVPPAAFFDYSCIDELAAAPGLLTGELQLSGAAQDAGAANVIGDDGEVPESYYDVSQFPEYERLKGQIDELAAAGLAVPYLQEIDRRKARRTVNYNTYNYLGLAGSEQVVAASKQAIDEYGSSMSSSPIVGQTSINVELEREVAEFVGTEAAVLFIGGWQTNVSSISILTGPGDLILCDALNHNSCVTGQKLSGATVLPFPHNDHEQADRILERVRRQYRRVLIVIEGVYSMDGDKPDLPAFVELKKKHHALLYVDEAHSLGTVGDTGRGLCEYYGVEPAEIDVIMGTLSKAFGSCGGFVAGRAEVVDLIKYCAGGFVFSVGLTPATAGAALAGLRAAQAEPQRVARLQQRAALFLRLAKEARLNVGKSHDSPVVPVIVGNTEKAMRLSLGLADRGINVKPIVYPAVEENQARLRFFVSYNHSEAQIKKTIKALAELCEELEIPSVSASDSASDDASGSGSESESE